MRNAKAVVRRYLPLAVVCLAVAAGHLGGAFEFLERLWMDARFRLTSRPASGELVLVEIDPKSLSRLSLWPWPRGYHATVIERLRAAGARRVGFDIDFSSRSVADEDRQFERSLEEAAGLVVLPTFQQWQYAGDGARQLVRVQPLPELRRHVTLASINVHPERDGIVRRYGVPLEATGADDVSLPFAAALAGYTAPPDPFYVDFGIQPATLPRLSYVDVLTGQFDPALVRGRIVVVGPTSVELGDQIAVPLEAALPGPHLQALAFESLAQGRALQRADRWLTLCVVALLGLLVGPLLAAVSWRRGLFVLLAAGGAVLALSVAMQVLAPVVLETTPWLVTLVGLYVSALILRIDQQTLGLLAQRLKLHRTEGLMRHVVENSFDAILTVDGDGRVETFNRSAQQMFGYPSEEIVGQPVTRLLHHDAREVRVLFQQPTGRPFELSGRCRDGRTFPLEMVVTEVEADEAPKRVAFLRDITERKAHQQALQHQATHDPLTDLPNRFLLMDRAAKVLAVSAERGTPAAVLLLDLDRFKEINDALGHHTGDSMLQQVAKRLQVPLEAEDTIARLGGDEFAVLLPRSDLRRARDVGTRLIEALRSPFRVDGLALQIDTSIGVTLFPEHGDDAETLIQRADVAMYVAKRRRSGLAVYQPEHDYNSIRHLTLRGDLRMAIRDSLLNLVYQPKISAETEDVVGVEALLRWNHPRHGMIPPDEFIGLAEHSGLIRPLTVWVIETALRQAAEWIHAGHRLVVSVNISARNLLDEDLPSTLETLLGVYGLSPDRLTLEITESVLMEDPERSLEVITRLNTLGVDISIDDFGTGYSSLGYLMRLPAREVKIDRSFVMQMDRDSGSATIVRSIIELAHNLGLSVVAEGVEGEETWRALKGLGCDVGQGYHFSRPMPGHDLLGWMQTRSGLRPTFPLPEAPEVPVPRVLRW